MTGDRVADPGTTESQFGRLADELAARVIDGLHAAGMSQRAFARSLGISEKHVSQVLRGQAGATVEMWDRMLAEVDR